MSAAPRLSHPGDLALRRLFAGEDVGADARQHAQSCGDCQARLKGYAEEQRRFEAEIPFERFAAGVERAQRTPHVSPVRGPGLQLLLSLAAMLLVAVGFGQLFSLGEDQGGRNRLKGGADVEMVVGGLGRTVQRVASVNPLVPEALTHAERVRIGYTPGKWQYVAVLSIDEAGSVTPLYPEAGSSLPALPPRAWLPDSIEFTGAGLERVVVVMTDEPTDMAVLAKEAKRRYDEAQGDLARMEPLQIAGEQFHRTFLKP